MTDAWAIVVVSISLLAMGLAWALIRIGELRREIEHAHALVALWKTKIRQLDREHQQSVRRLEKLARKMGYEWTTPSADWAQE